MITSTRRRLRPDTGPSAAETPLVCVAAFLLIVVLLRTL
jgi:hypothetical protein